MLYIKIFDLENKLIGIEKIEDVVYVNYQTTNNLLVRCEKEEYEGIVSFDGSKIYAKEGFMLDKNVPHFIEISEEEYLSLLPILEENQEFIKSSNENNEVDFNNDVDLSNLDDIEFAIETKIQSMSFKCKQTILNGFDVDLTDRLKHHFSLEITDQLKIEKLYSKAKNGEIILPYHADNEEFKFYSYEDIVIIHSKMEYTIDYNTVYFNSLKSYIQSLNSVEEINSIYYGIEIPEEYQSEVLKTFK